VTSWETIRLEGKQLELLGAHAAAVAAITGKMNDKDARDQPRATPSRSVPFLFPLGGSSPVP
jgi:hypothetical protein